MKRGVKPVRRCHACLLNMGPVCWAYANPRRQWHKRRCPGFENAALYHAFNEWRLDAHVKTRKQLRQMAFSRNPRRKDIELQTCWGK